MPDSRANATSGSSENKTLLSTTPTVPLGATMRDMGRAAVGWAKEHTARPPPDKGIRPVSQPLVLCEQARS